MARSGVGLQNRGRLRTLIGVHNTRAEPHQTTSQASRRRNRDRSQRSIGVHNTCAFLFVRGLVSSLDTADALFLWHFKAGRCLPTDGRGSPRTRLFLLRHHSASAKMYIEQTRTGSFNGKKTSLTISAQAVWEGVSPNCLAIIMTVLLTKSFNECSNAPR